LLLSIDPPPAARLGRLAIASCIRSSLPC
jgi:hypothetical protein